MVNFVWMISVLTVISLQEGLASEPRQSIQARAKQLEASLASKGRENPKALTPPKRPASPAPVSPAPASASKLTDQKKCQQTPSEHVRILSIDGGGVRGLIPATVIAEMEKDLGVSITKAFDYFIGNSAGGMLSLILTKPDPSGTKPELTAAEVVEKVKDLSASMFGGVQKTALDKAKASLTKAKNLLSTGAQYNPKVLEALSAELFGSVKLSQAVKPVFITTFDLNSEQTLLLSTLIAKRAKLFDFKMADIARATSAAPFYFPVYPLEFMNNESGTGLKMQLIDGGVGSNNPTLIGTMEIIRESRKYCSVPSYEIVSLGTGVGKHYFEKKDMGNKGSPLLMLNPTIGGFMSAQTQSANDATKEFVNFLNSLEKKNNHYTRLQVSLAIGDKKLDDVREQATENLSKKAQEIIKSTPYKKMVDRLKTQLCEEGVYRKESENMHKRMCSPTPR